MGPLSGLRLGQKCLRDTQQKQQPYTPTYHLQLFFLEQEKNGWPYPVLIKYPVVNLGANKKGNMHFHVIFIASYRATWWDDVLL